MFADFFTLKLGETEVKGRRLKIKELQDSRELLAEGRLDIEKSVEVIKAHVTLADGKPFDPYDLSTGQMRTLIAELVLPKEGRGIADFIGTLC
jgi:hypothetical protein